MAAIPSRYERTRCVRRGWVFERVGWVAMALIVTGAVMGVFGGGGLGRAEASAGGELTVAYPRFARAHAPLEMTVDWLARDPPTVWITRSYLDGFTLEGIEPAPAAVTAAEDRIYYEFRTLAPESRLRVRFRLEPQRGGAFRGRIGAGSADVELRQFVFP